jgi:hypothetical protein
VPSLRLGVSKLTFTTGNRCVEKLEKLHSWTSTVPGLEDPLTTLCTAQIKLSVMMLDLKAGICTQQEAKDLAQTFAIKLLFPDEEWPDHLAPMPRLPVIYGDDYFFKPGQDSIGFGMCLHGVLSAEVRHGSEFVRLLSLVTLRMEYFNNHLHSSDLRAKAKHRREGVPTLQVMRTVIRGYAHELSRICVSLFGPESAYSKALLNDKKRVLRGQDGRPACFTVEQFDAVQVQVLEWAKVDDRKKIILTDI